MRPNDLIQRWIQQVAAALAKVLGLKAAGQDTEAEQVMTQAYPLLFGVDFTLVKSLDLSSLRALLGGDPAKLKALAQVLETHAGLLEARGDGKAAALLRARAGQLA